MSVRPFVRIGVFSCCVVALFLCLVGQAQARSVSTQHPVSVGKQEVLHLLGTVTIPGTPASQWCYDTAVVDDGTYYLADNDRAGIDVIHDGKNPATRASSAKGNSQGSEAVNLAIMTPTVLKDRCRSRSNFCGRWE